MNILRLLVGVTLAAVSLQATPSLSWNQVPSDYVITNTEFPVEIRAETGSPSILIELTLFRNGSYYASTSEYQSEDEYGQLSPVFLTTTMCESSSGNVELVAQASDYSGTDSISATVSITPPWGACEVWNTIDNPAAWFWVRPGEAILLEGWALDPLNNMSVSDIHLRLDGSLIAAGTQLNLTHPATGTNSGWKAWFVVPPPYSTTMLTRWLQVYIVDNVGTERLIDTRPMVVTTHGPMVRHYVPKPITVLANQKVPIYSRSIHSAGTAMAKAGISIRDPEGYWSHNSSRPWMSGDEAGILANIPPNGSDSVREGYFRFPYAGEWKVRGSASDSTGAYHRYSSFKGFVVNVTAHTPPVASFTASAISGSSPLLVTFNASASSPGCTYSWDFDGNGTFDAEGLSPSWTFRSDVGGQTPFIVRLRVTDTNQVEAIASKCVTVTVPQQLACESAGWASEGDYCSHSFTLSQTSNLQIGYSGGSMELRRSDGTLIENYQSVGAGSYQVNIWGYYDGDEYIGDTSVRVEYTTNAPRTAQAIVFPQPVLAPGVTSVVLTAWATSGLPVSYSVSGPGSLTGNTLSIQGLGTIVVHSTQCGDGTWAPATHVQRYLVVTDSLPQGTITKLNDDAFYGESLAVLANTPWMLTGEASDPDGTPVTVKIYQNGQFLGNATMAEGSNKWTYQGMSSLPVNVAQRQYVLEAKVPVISRWGAQSELEIPLLSARTVTVCKDVPIVTLDVPTVMTTIQLNSSLELKSYAMRGTKALTFHAIQVFTPNGQGNYIQEQSSPSQYPTVSQKIWQYTFSEVGDYVIRAVASDGNGIVYGPDANGVRVRVESGVNGIPAPQLLLGHVSSDVISFVWGPVVRPMGVDGYRIYRNGQLLATLGSNVLYYRDNTVVPGQAYSYSIKAFSYGVESALSAAISATALSRADTNPSNSVPDHLEIDVNPLPGDQSILGTKAKNQDASLLLKVTSPAP